MTQNGEFVQTDEAARNTAFTAELIRKEPTIGAVIGNLGKILGVLAWFDGDGTRWASIDDGKITAPASGRGDVTVRIQDQRTGLIRTITMPDIVTAFYSLGLSAERCNGINGWLALELMGGTAGCD